MAIELSDDLIALQRAVVEAQQLAHSQPYSEESWKPWREAAVQVQAAVTAHAEATGQDRNKVEAEVKLAVLHPEEYAAKLAKEAAKK